MKKIVVAGIVCMVCVGVTVAEDAIPAAPAADVVVEAVAAPAPVVEAPAIEAQDVVLKGVVSKIERPGKEGEAAKVTYMLTDADGHVTRLPESQAPEGEAAIDLASLVGAEVTVTGKGMVREADGKKMVHLRSISAIAKVAVQE
jgi:hypothetical protein